MSKSDHHSVSDTPESAFERAVYYVWDKASPLQRAGIVFATGATVVGGLFILSADDAERSEAARAHGALVAPNIPNQDTPSFYVDSPDGPILCYGEVVLPVEQGGSVGNIVLENTRRPVPAQTLAQPRLDLIVDQVLINNGIEDPLLVPADTAIAVPEVCEFDQ